MNAYEHMSIWAYFAYLFCIFCILTQNMLNRIGPCWTVDCDSLRIHQSNNNQGHIVLYSTLLIGHTQHKGHTRLSSWPFVPRKLQQTNRQDMESIRLGYLMALFSSGWITYGSARFCSCSKSLQRQTLACSTTSVSMFQCWKSTRAHENQVIFCIFCIFCIL
jgi:hypothetical protein